MLIDSNIIIYAAQPQHTSLRALLADPASVVSAVSYVEVLGYHGLGDAERAYLEAFFAAASLLPLSQDVLDWAVKLRQMHKMTLGDALVAGTAMAHVLPLVTRNTGDFDWIPGLKTVNPLTPPP